MLTLEFRCLTGSDRRSSDTRKDAKSLKIEQHNKDDQWVLLNDSNQHLEHFEVLNYYYSLKLLFKDLKINLVNWRACLVTYALWLKSKAWAYAKT